MKKNEFTIEAIQKQFRLNGFDEGWVFKVYSFISPDIIKGSLEYTNYDNDISTYTHYFFRNKPGYCVETNNGGVWWEWKDFWNKDESRGDIGPERALKILKKRGVDITEYLFSEDEETRDAAVKILKKV